VAVADERSLVVADVSKRQSAVPTHPARASGNAPV
jgi:hypothetical protein